MNKKLKISIIIFGIISILINSIAFAADKITITMTQEDDSRINVNINSEKKIKNVRIYLKRDNSNYQLFYESKQVNSNNKNYKIPRSRLSSEKETYFKVIVIDEENTEISKEFKAEKLKPLPTPNPIPPPAPDQPSEIAPTAIKLNKTNVNISIGQTVQLTATITPSNATNKAITWTSSNPNIATVNSTGKVTGKTQGTATITVQTSNGKTARCTVNVTNTKTTSFKVTANKEIKSQYLTFKSTTTTIQKMKIKKGSSISLANLMKKTTKATSATWSSENPKIATVSSAGVVKGISKGTTKITAVTNNGYTITLNVEVTTDGYDVFYDSNGKIVSDTNTILAILGKTDTKYYMRVHVGKSKAYKKITLTIYAPDLNGNYQIPVRSCLIGIFRDFWNNKNKWRTDLYLGMCNSTAAEWSQVPGCWTPYRIGFIWGYFHSIPYKKDGSGYAYGYNDQGTCISAGCERLFWQDLAWVYYHCPKGTKCKFVADEDPGPLGVGYRYPTSTSKWPGYTTAKKLYGK